MLQINELNWTFCQYTHNDCRAQIHTGGELDPKGEYKELFYVNILKSDENTPDSLMELEQTAFDQLNDAVTFINQRFSHWKFDNQLEGKKDLGGCGSCVAH